LVRKLKVMGKFPNKKRYYLHIDNARPHTSQLSSDYIDHHKFIKILHPPYSPNIAPSDFYLFGKPKNKLAKCHGTTKEELFQKVEAILNSCSEKELMYVFKNWMGRLGQVIETGGEYI
jgi:hypothetical protein